jgi:hypothetical protein
VEVDFNTVLAGSFGVWAGVVAWGVRRVTAQLEGIGQELKDQSKKLNEYIVDTETRLARIEERMAKNGSR